MTRPGIAFAQDFPGATTCIVVGPLPSGAAIDFTPFRAVLRITDVPDAAGSPRPRHGTRVERASPSSRLAPLLEAFVRHDARNLPSLFITAAAGISGEECLERLLAEILSEIESHHRARVTRQRDGYSWQAHVLGNLPAFVRRRFPESWRDALEGATAFVCGAGPSLDISAPALARAAASGVVFAADSALHTLARHGIAADFVVSIDAAKQPGKCLPPSGFQGRFILSAVSPPAWRKLVPDERLVFLGSRQLTIDWLGSAGIQPPALAVSESCGVTALEAARFLGCRKIHLFGLDLALDDDAPGRRHTSGADASLYVDSGFDPAQTFPVIPGNWRPSVPTHVIGDWRALDARLARWPRDLVVNVTDRGARLSNTAIVRPSDFTPPKGILEDKAALLARLPAPGAPDQAAIAGVFGQLRELGHRGFATAAEASIALEQAGPEGACAVLRRSFADRSFGRAMGGFSLKILPHLLPPVEPDSTLWCQLIHELATLSEAAIGLQPETREDCAHGAVALAQA